MRASIKRIALGFVLVVVVGITAGALTMDRWLFVVLDPGAFVPEATPRKPNYAKESSWAALPSTKDGADVALSSHPAIDQTKAPADVFYVHPTTSVGPVWNASIHAPDVIHATHRGGTLIQASAFNGCCAVYAPRYRQANGKAFLSPNTHSKRAANVAFSDVKTAFRYFLTHHNKGRPFVLAAHSQGSIMATRLLKEVIWKDPAIAQKMVVAYLPGAPLRQRDLGTIPVCRSAQQTGCVIGWNSRGPRYVSSRLDFPNPHSDDPTRQMEGLLCVNPLTWKQDDKQATTSQHKGAIFFDAQTPAVLPAFANARCHNGRLLITKMGRPVRHMMSKILDWVTGPQNYHPIEYQLFYLNIRANATQRVKAFQSTQKTKSPKPATR